MRHFSFCNLINLISIGASETHGKTSSVYECHVFTEISRLSETIIMSQNIYNRALQHSMGNFYREFPQLRCTELQLKMRLAGLHLQLKRVAHEQNTRLAVSSRA
jgi:hypothetical protein